jgi:hypothetical protein
MANRLTQFEQGVLAGDTPNANVTQIEQAVLGESATTRLSQFEQAVLGEFAVGLLSQFMQAVLGDVIPDFPSAQEQSCVIT